MAQLEFDAGEVYINYGDGVPWENDDTSVGTMTQPEFFCTNMDFYHKRLFQNNVHPEDCCASGEMCEYLILGAGNFYYCRASKEIIFIRFKDNHVRTESLFKL